MLPRLCWHFGCAAACLFLMASTALGTDKPLIDLAKESTGKRLVVSTPGEVTVKRAPDSSGTLVTCRPGKGEWPGVAIKPPSAAWDLSQYGHVEAKITNTGALPITVALRVDNSDSGKGEPWNSENAYPKPGETVTIRVRFGYSWGNPGFKLDPSHVSQILVFTTKSNVEQSFQIESVEAGGAPGERPPVNPADIRSQPKDGFILASNGVLDSSARSEPHGVRAAVDKTGLHVTIPAGADDAYLRLTPTVGRWDLRQALQVTIRARNTGKAPVTLKAKLESGTGECPWKISPQPLAPGGTQTLTIPFAGDILTLSADGKYSGGGKFESDRAAGVVIAATGEGERELLIESVRATAPAPPALPVWLGKRPPVPGVWKETMAEEFTGSTLNEKLWTIYHPNYWDKNSHFSKANDILGGGLLRLRFEKKRGHADDDPAKPETDWATGFLTGTHKFTQRYGYFECRMKLPHAPGMWPAFWMMPDRGEAAGAAREDTRNGGMEFDILEYLARYGPYRYNIAVHWDGYEKDHKSIGDDHFYLQPDRDGFFTAGLLWEPGKATWYCNGAPIATWSDPRVASVPEYILFTAVSGGWGGNELTGEDLPDDTVLDYVRVWQRADWE